MTASRPAVRILLPAERAGEEIPAAWGEPVLARLYAHPAHPDGRPYVRATMVSTLDGAATGDDHRSGTINNAVDHRAFRLQRALADVVLVGAGTARAEGYRGLGVPAELARLRAGRHPLPVLAVVTTSGALPEVLLAADEPPLVLTTSASASLGALRERLGEHQVVVVGRDRISPALALRALADRGLRRVLCEGGPHLLETFLAAGLVDELCLTWSPLLVGGPAPRILDGPAFLDPPRRARLAHLLHGDRDGVLLARWVVEPAGQARDDGAEHGGPLG